MNSRQGSILFSLEGIRFLILPLCGCLSATVSYGLFSLFRLRILNQWHWLVMTELVIMLAFAISMALPVSRLVKSLAALTLGLLIYWPVSTFITKYDWMWESEEFRHLRILGLTHVSLASAGLVMLDYIRQWKSAIRWLVGSGIALGVTPAAVVVALLWTNSDLAWIVERIYPGIFGDFFRAGLYATAGILMPKFKNAIAPNEIALRPIPEPKPILLLLLMTAGVIGGAFLGGFSHYYGWFFKHPSTQMFVWMGGLVGIAIGSSVAMSGRLWIRLVVACSLGFVGTIVALGFGQVISYRVGVPTFRDSWILVAGVEFGIPTTVLMVWAHHVALSYRWSWSVLAGLTLVFGSLGAWSGLMYWSGEMYFPDAWRPSPGGLWFTEPWGFEKWICDGSIGGVAFGWFQMLSILAAQRIHEKFGHRLAR